MKNSLSSYVRNTAFRPAGLSRGSSSSEAFWNAPFSLSNSSIFSPVNCWNTRGFVLASSYFIFFPPLPSFYSLLHGFPIDSREHIPITHPPRHLLQQQVVPHIVEVSAEIDVDDARLALVDGLGHPLHRFMSCPPRSVAKRTRLEVSLEDGFQDEPGHWRVNPALAAPT